MYTETNLEENAIEKKNEKSPTLNVSLLRKVDYYWHGSFVGTHQSKRE